MSLSNDELSKRAEKQSLKNEIDNFVFAQLKHER